MSNFNFKVELEDQKKELIEQYGDEIAVQQWDDDDIYDGEYCNPPSYRWSATFLHTSMTEQTSSQHDEPTEDKEDSSSTVHSYGLKDGETLSFPVHKKSSWPVVPI